MYGRPFFFTRRAAAGRRHPLHADEFSDPHQGPASSFRAAWTPVQTPEFGDVPEHLHAARRASVSRDDAPARTARRSQSLRRPDAPPDNRSATHRATCRRCRYRGPAARCTSRPVGPSAAARAGDPAVRTRALLLITSLVWGAAFAADPARGHAARLRYLLGVALDQQRHPRVPRLPRDARDGAGRLAAALRRREHPATTRRSARPHRVGRRHAPGHHPDVQGVGRQAARDARQARRKRGRAREAARRARDGSAPTKRPRSASSCCSRISAAASSRSSGTTHPCDIPGEVRGKSSNEAWAAKQAKRLFCDEMGYDIDNMTVTSRATPTRCSIPATSAP